MGLLTFPRTVRLVMRWNNTRQRHLDNISRGIYTLNALDFGVYTGMVAARIRWKTSVILGNSCSTLFWAISRFHSSGEQTFSGSILLARGDSRSLVYMGFGTYFPQHRCVVVRVPACHGENCQFVQLCRIRKSSCLLLIWARPHLPTQVSRTFETFVMLFLSSRQ